MPIQIPQAVETIINCLEQNGFEAWAVGGCVRDALMGRTPNDWDICTDALPEQTMQCCRNFPVLETGIRHGTVTVMIDAVPYEVTTYRTDGDYTDHRRPDTVRFVRSLQLDLARRDFTVNAMAYHPKRGLVDCFGGQQDIADGIIRSVGRASVRYEEDALRILRAIRFAAVLHFTMEPETERALFEKKDLLCFVSAERIQGELNRMLQQDAAAEILARYREIIAVFLPELVPMFHCEQRHSYHIYPVWEHTLEAMRQIDNDSVLRLTMLLHDSGKPKSKTVSEDGITHFHGHHQESLKIAEQILARPKYDRATTARIKELIFYHDAELLPDLPHIKRWLARIGPEQFFSLLRVKRADILAQNPKYSNRLQTLCEVEKTAREILADSTCFSVHNLAVSGNDLIALGIRPGIRLGTLLQELTDLVIDEKLPNEKQALLNYVTALRGTKEKERTK